MSVASPTLIILLFISLFERCEAQGSDVVFVIPIIVVGVAMILICCCFWINLSISCYRRHKSKNIQLPSFHQTPTAQHVFNIQRQQNYAQSQVIDVGNQRYPLQSYSSPSSRVISPPLTTTNGFTATSQTPPQATQPRSSSEATLHQNPGEAPPDYVEAIRMKTVSQDLL